MKVVPTIQIVLLTTGVTTTAPGVAAAWSPMLVVLPVLIHLIGAYNEPAINIVLIHENVRVGIPVSTIAVADQRILTVLAVLFRQPQSNKPSLMAAAKRVVKTVNVRLISAVTMVSVV